MQRITTSTLAALLALAGCGGSSGGSSGGAVDTPAPPTLTLSASADQTLAGGKAITLSGSSNSGTAPAWSLAAGSAGSLSAASGASVSYTPPAAVAANTAVSITASVGGVSKTLALTVFPEPGAAGLSVVAGRLNADMLDAPADGPGASARFGQSLAVAGDLAGNLYVMGSCRQTQTHLLGLSLRKIGSDGAVATLASCYNRSWFGPSDPAGNLDQFAMPRGIAVDRAGNMYTTNTFGATRAVFKITPQGVLSTLAGAAADTATLADGKGAAARFLTPAITGIDGDDNLYALDKDGSVVRKITPAGEVTTVAAAPASLRADLNGNTYRVDAATGAVIQTTPAGTDSTIANINTLPGVLPGMPLNPYSLVRTGPATYALVVGNGYTFPNEVIVKLVVPH